MDLLASLAAESARFADVLAGCSPNTPVPSCADWTAADLAWHLTEVHWFWGTVVLSGSTDEPDESLCPPRPDTLDATISLLREQSARLVAALDSADPAVPLFSWHPEHDSLAWVLRRQAHEAIIHRADAELTAGDITPIDAKLATDGVDELLQMYLTGVPAWATFTPGPTDVTIVASDTGHAWGLQLGKMTGTSTHTGNVYEGDTALDAAMLEQPRRDPTATLRGPAAALDRWLWGRGPIDEIEVTGDEAVATELRTFIADATQ